MTMTGDLVEQFLWLDKAVSLDSSVGRIRGPLWLQTT